MTVKREYNYPELADILRGRISEYETGSQLGGLNLFDDPSSRLGSSFKQNPLLLNHQASLNKDGVANRSSKDCGRVR
jgi:hypothetical protein